MYKQQMTESIACAGIPNWWMHTLYSIRSSVLSAYLWSVKPDLPACVCDFAQFDWVLSEAPSQRSLPCPIWRKSLVALGVIHVSWKPVRYNGGDLSSMRLKSCTRQWSNCFIDKMGVTAWWQLKDIPFNHDLNFDFFDWFWLTELYRCLKS